MNSPGVLDVYLSGVLVGKLKSDTGILSFTYSSDYLKYSTKKLSTSFPLQSQSFDHRLTYSFFSGLLPDGIIRTRLARHLGLSENNIFSLLEKIGGECAGAVSIYKEGDNSSIASQDSYRILDESEADEVLSSLSKTSLLEEEDEIRISCAGAQDKLAIAFIDGKIAIPMNNSPSTHIIKPPISDLANGVYNEFFCMKLAKKLGLQVPEVKILWIKNKAYYLVERYDRKLIRNKIIRLHQEDFCQALHIPPENKYENEGGPGIFQCFSLLEDRIKFGSMACKNKLLLLRSIIFNFLIGNGDAHGKNFSLLYDLEEESLAPLYDLLCTIIYSRKNSAKMAMKINGKYQFRLITMNDWECLAILLGMRPDFVKRNILDLSHSIINTAPKLAMELNADPKTKSPIYTKILSVISESSYHYLN